jgi:citrate/tricarballylate utilization protein
MHVHAAARVRGQHPEGLVGGAPGELPRARLAAGLRGAVHDPRRALWVAATAVAAVLGLACWLSGLTCLFGLHREPGAFYQVVPYWAMVAPGLVVVCWWLGVWVAGGVRFWRETASDGHAAPTPRALAVAVRDALTMRWLRGGGPGCAYPGERPSRGRGVLHAFVFYGFLAALASTTLAAINQDLLGRVPPYPLVSAPVVLGALGGAAMLGGTAGMLIAEVRSDRRPAADAMACMDYAFVVTLGLASMSGLLALALRGTHAMGLMTAPYGKFVHLVYRFLALVRYRLEQGAEG